MKTHILENIIIKIIKRVLTENTELNTKYVFNNKDKFAEILLKIPGVRDFYAVEFKDGKITDNIFIQYWNANEKQRMYKPINKNDINPSHYKKIIKLAQEEYDSYNYEYENITNYKEINDLTDIKLNDYILFEKNDSNMKNVGKIISIKGKNIIIQTEYMGQQMMKIKYNLDNINILKIKRK